MMYEWKNHLQIYLVRYNKEKSSHSRVTELEFIRWRATVFGTKGQRIFAAIKANKISFAVVDNENGISTDATLAPSAQSTKKGSKHCSNHSCPLKSRYVAATCKNLWCKCIPNCFRCDGRTHVCPHPECLKIIVEEHKASEELYCG